MLIILCIALEARHASSWSNGGFSSDPTHPVYGTHDWIAQHVLDWLPSDEKQCIQDNLATYLYGTELPDNSGAADGIGDSSLHHFYYRSNGSIQDDISAVRAQTEYNKALNYIQSNNIVTAVKSLGIMSHYIADLSVFGHVMGSGTDWGPEIHHSDYETYVNERTNNYTDEFNSYLTFDGSLDVVSAYNAASALAYDTTFNPEGGCTCVWMDQNYNWSNPAFKNRVGESLNLAVNCLADVLHTFAQTELLKDIAVTSVAPSKTVVGEGYSVLINVTVMNKGNSTETLNMTVCANVSGEPEPSASWYYAVTLTGGSSAPVILTWNTSGFAKGNYTITCQAEALLGEANTTDNTRCSWIMITIPGDIKGDGTVDIFDAIAMAAAFDSAPDSSNWTPNADINSDNVVDIYDAIILAGNYGKTA